MDSQVRDTVNVQDSTAHSVQTAEQTPEQIREQVRLHYGARAATRTSCCTPNLIELTPAAVDSAAVDSAAAACCVPAAPGSDACCAPLDANAESCCTPHATGDVTVDVEARGAVGVRNYNADELQGIDADTAEFSLGCGNPTAIAALQAGEVVLDLGSGGGLDVFLAARRVGPGGFVYGVDMTDEMLELARRNAAKMAVSNVEFRKGHIEDIPLENGTVDVIISNCVVNLSPDKGETLREAFRVLKPGGRLAISDIVIDGRLDDLTVTEAQVRTALSWAGCIAGALTIDQFKELLSAAGFEDIQIDVRQRYSLEALGQDLDAATQHLPATVVEDLVGRFTSSTIAARRPQ